MWPLPHYLIVCVGVLIAGCGSGDRPTTEGLVHDALGRSIQLPPAISRVVTLAPSVTEMVFAAGAGNMLVGVTLSDSYPPAVSALPRFNTYPVDLERIVALDPDLALASDQVNHPEQVRALAELGIPTYFLSSRSVEEMLEQIVELGRLLETEEFASRTVDSLQSRIERLRKRTASIESRPSVLVLAGAQPLYAFGSESYVHQLVEWGGGISVTGSIGTTTPVLSDEYVLRTAPDVIIGTDSLHFTADLLLAMHPTWDIVPAILNRRVFALDPDLVYRPGPRLVEAAYEIARALHPDRMIEY